MRLLSSKTLSVIVTSIGVLTACKPPQVADDHLQPVRAEEAFDKSAVSCTSVRPQTEPDLMAWDSTSRANLSRLRSKGIVAVRYSAKGCNVELELLSNCIAKGKYEFAPYSANEHKVAHNENELYAALPLGANRLSGKLKGNRALRTDYMLAGTYAIAPGSTVEEAALQGPDCAKATHVVSAVYVGGFALAAGETRSLDAQATLFGFGGGAASRADIESVSNEGNAEACKQAQSDGAESPMCSVPLRIGLLAIKRAGTVDPSARTVATAALAALPPAPVETEGVKLDADADVLVAYDAALKADANGTADGERAAAAWRAVAALKKKNPYLTTSLERAERWSEYAAKKKARQAQQQADTERLRKILPLDSLPLEQKERVLRDYVRLYGTLAAIDLTKLVKPEKVGLELADRLAVPVGTFADRYTALDKLGLSRQPARRAATECEGGNRKSCAALAVAFQDQWVWKANGSGLSWDSVKASHIAAALELFERVCQAGDKDGCMDRLRLQSASGDAAEKGQAERQLEEKLASACDAGLTASGDWQRAKDSCAELSKLYGGSSLKDPAKADEARKKFFRIALRQCQVDEVSGCNDASNMFAGPEIEKEARRRGRILRAKSCEAGDPYWCRVAGEEYASAGEEERSRALYLKGAAISHKRCSDGATDDCVEEGRFFQEAGDSKKALALWTPLCHGKIADDGDARGMACLRAADMLSRGEGLPANRAASVPFYRRACVALKETPCTRGPE